MPKVKKKISSGPIFPYWATTDSSHCLYLGDVISVLRRLPSRSAHMVVTSPPYWGLRNYQTNDKNEIGIEDSPQEYIDRMVAVFRELRRVLRVDGTVWLNIGDTYGGGTTGGHGDNSPLLKGRVGAMFKSNYDTKLDNGNLVGIPWRLAFALQADGWILRQDIIWSKPNPMRESVRNRCTKSHEYIFLLSQSSDYYYDAEAIKTEAEPAVRITGGLDGTGRSGSLGQARGLGSKPSGNGILGSVLATGSKANKLSVWSIPPQGYDGAHFAVYPPALIEPCIKAGTSEYGACAKCGSPWERVISRERYPTRPGLDNKMKRKLSETQSSIDSSTLGSIIGNRDAQRHLAETKTIGWRPTCYCKTDEVVPCTVLDPFVGSGTTSYVCVDLGRRSIGIDLSETYLRNNAVPRIEGALLSRRMGDLIPG